MTHSFASPPCLKEHLSSFDTPRAGAAHRALLMPDIVEPILSYVVNPPEYPLPSVEPDADKYHRPDICRTLHWIWWCPLLVCKQWLEIGLRLRIPSPTVWDPRQMTGRQAISAQLITELIRTRRLELKGIKTLIFDPWDDLRADKRVWKRLHEFIVKDYLDADGMFWLYLIPTFARHLRTLRIELKDSAKVDVSRLLLRCAPVQDGSYISPVDSSSQSTISSPKPVHLLPYLRRLSLSTVRIVDIPSSWTLGHPLQLEELRLEAVRISNSSLATLLQALCGPNLHAFHLEDWISGFPVLDWSPEGRPSELLKHFMSWAPNIQNLTMDRGTVDPPHFFALINLFSRAKYVRLHPRGESITAIVKNVTSTPLAPLPRSATNAAELAATPTMMTPMRDTPFTTHLHIDSWWCMKSHPEYMYHFVQFLQSEAAVHLEELVAPKVEYTTTTFIEGADKRRFMWRCRNLKVLALAFGTQTQADRSDWYPARTMMGFIVVNCPQLRYLEIRRHLLNMSIRCGICFLSRLKHLERLVISTSQFSSWGGNQGTVKLARWMRERPTALDVALGQSSLALCRRVAKLDADAGYFGLPEGREILWPPGAKRIAASGRKGTGAEEISQGACWHSLKSIFVEITGKTTTEVVDTMKNIESERALMREAFPNLEYTLHVRG